MATGIQTGMQRGSRSGISRGSGLGKGAPGGGGGPLGKAAEIWKNLGKGARIGISVLATIVVVGALVFSIHSSNNQYVDLYATKMTSNDVTEVSAALTEMRVPHQVNETSDGILIHPKKRISTQAMLANKNLPRHHVLTPDQVEGGMGKTAAEQKAIRKRLLEGEITLALREMQGVNDARVQLAIPNKTYFADDSKRTKARIFVRLSRDAKDSLNRQKIQSMVNLVAFSVPELDTKDVKIIDSEMNDLTAMLPQAEQGQMVASSTQMEIKNTEQEALQKKAQDALDAIMPGKTKVSVNLEMDFSQVEEERFTPGGAADDGVVVESRQIKREVLNKGEGNSGSDEGGTQLSGGPQGKDGKDYLMEVESVNNLVGQRKVKRVDTSHRIKRLTCAVMADNVSEEEQAAIAGYVESAIGIDPARGDQITIHNMPFTRPAFVNGGADPFGTPAGGALPAANPISGNTIAIALTVGAAMMLGLVGMFLFKQHSVKGAQGNIIGSTAGGVTSTAITDHFTDKSGKTTAPVSSAGATQVNTTDQLEKLVKERPTKVAEMLKSTWLQ